MVCINGAAARLTQPGDKIIVIAYCWLDAEEARTYNPTVVIVDDQNRAVQTHDGRQYDLKLV
jgi:aspartate 1-decarboxylase